MIIQALADLLGCLFCSGSWQCTLRQILNGDDIEDGVYNLLKQIDISSGLIKDVVTVEIVSRRIAKFGGCDERGDNIVPSDCCVDRREWVQ